MCASLIIPWQRCVVKHVMKFLKILGNHVNFAQNVKLLFLCEKLITDYLNLLKTKHFPSCLALNHKMFIWSLYSMQIILIKCQGNCSTAIWNPYIGKNYFHIYNGLIMVKLKFVSYLFSLKHLVKLFRTLHCFFLSQIGLKSS